jgi:predicted NBD/HSP70 family sugar kinase
VIGIHIAHSRGLITGLYGVLMSLNLTGELSDPVVKTLDGNDGVDGIANDAADVVAELRRCAQNLGADVLGVGLELGAHVAGDEIVESTNTGWGHVALADDVARLVGLPVILENDVNARAVTYIYRHTFLEQDFGLVCVFDEGIGAALVVNGRLYRGSAGGAGEIGHCSAEYPPVAGRSPMEGFAAPCRCGGLGHVEALAAPARIAAELGVLDLTSAASEPLYDDNERVTATASVFRRSGTALGRGLCAMANLTNPGRIHVSLPAVLAMAAPGTAGSAYVDAAEAALNEAYSTAARDARAGAGRLTLEPWWPEDLARTGARAAAACVIDTLIEHARGRDACRALDASRGQSEQS